MPQQVQESQSKLREFVPLIAVFSFLVALICAGIAIQKKYPVSLPVTVSLFVSAGLLFWSCIASALGWGRGDAPDTYADQRQKIVQVPEAVVPQQNEHAAPTEEQIDRWFAAAQKKAEKRKATRAHRRDCKERAVTLRARFAPRGPRPRGQ